MESLTRSHLAALEALIHGSPRDFDTLLVLEDLLELLEVHYETSICND